VFHTVERMQVAVPLSIVRQLRPALADRAEGAKLEGRLVAWPNAAQPGMTTDPRAPAWWAHGVTAVEVVSAARTLGRALYLPEAAPPGARAGASLYAQRCLACHRLRGAGGLRGPELTRVAARLGPGELTRRLEGHPGWSIAGQADPSSLAAAQLDAFLRTISAYDALPGHGPEADGEGEDGDAGRVEPSPEPPPLEP